MNQFTHHCTANAVPKTGQATHQKDVPCGPLYFISGGCRSGKSAFAQSLAEHLGNQRLFIATAYGADDDMHERIANHQAVRGPSWHTYELPKGSASCLHTLVPDHLKTLSPCCTVVLLDCLTLWASACIEEEVPCQAAARQTDTLIASLRSTGVPVVIVSNEVGLGVVPGSRQARIFRDFAGIANQRAARAADCVVFMVSGISAVMKGFLPCFFTPV